MKPYKGRPMLVYKGKLLRYDYRGIGYGAARIPYRVPALRYRVPPFRYKPSQLPYTPTPAKVRVPARAYPYYPRLKREVKRKVKRRGPAPAFVPMVRRYGKWKPIGKPTTYGRALRMGTEYAKTTLGAAFKVVPTKYKVTKPDIPFKVPKEVFRKLIKMGIEQKASPIFIQRGGKEVTYVKGARLAAPGEIREIQLLKRKKQTGGKMKWI
jgi:hypothetical protein